MKWIKSPYLGDGDEAVGEAEEGTTAGRLGGFDFDLDLTAGSRDAVSLSATVLGRGFAVGLLDAMSYAIRQPVLIRLLLLRYVSR